MITDGTYLGLGEMKEELDYLRQRVRLQDEMITALCAPVPDAGEINEIADKLAELNEEFFG